MKNDEERWKTFSKSPTETSQKRYGSTSTWIFFTKTIFLTNFKWFSDTRRVERICSALLPLGKLGCWASWAASTRRHRLLWEHPGRPKWAWLLFVHPIYKIHPLCPFFCWFFFRNVTELYELRNDTCFLSVMSRNLTDYAIIPSLASGMLRNFTNYVMILVFFP